MKINDALVSDIVVKSVNMEFSMEIKGISCEETGNSRVT